MGRGEDDFRVYQRTAAQHFRAGLVGRMQIENDYHPREFTGLRFLVVVPGYSESDAFVVPRPARVPLLLSGGRNGSGVDRLRVVRVVATLFLVVGARVANVNPIKTNTQRRGPVKLNRNAPPVAKRDIRKRQQSFRILHADRKRRYFPINFVPARPNLDFASLQYSVWATFIAYNNAFVVYYKQVNVLELLEMVNY